MSENTKIEWCDHTWSPWEGCQKVGPGCDHCYAEARNARFAGGTPANWGPGAPRRRTVPNSWKLPLRWDRKALDMGKRLRIFPSLCDPFDNAVDPAWRADLFDLIERTPNLDWLLLTKRIGNVPTMLRHIGADRLPDNVWLGATIVNQTEADRDIPKLLEVPARVRFLSMEPLLGPVDLTSIPWGGHRVSVLQGWSSPEHGLHWVIAGGESGSGARPMHPDWSRSLRDQCSTAGVPFLFKQHGEWAPGSGDFGSGRFETAAIAYDGRIAPGGHRVDDYPHGAASSDGWSMVHRAGKRAAGRLLDGRTHNEFPEAR
ncbi:phage Gp37/Gp68 family protein [Burkholderia cepacia]|uniref:phage Gp37/Gp68 family protein n=1 Tax=Burkholderia cepacia TaxID=292 RepID=UPI002ABE22CE|nr:phage Gp37/Gp68 family protein [Burkholderia cepacia]